MTNTLLVCGSRYIPRHISQAFYISIIERALANGWHIIAGDAKGVDHSIAWAATASQFSELAPFMMVYGIQPKPRHGITSAQILYADISERCKSYTERDMFMLSQATHIYAIWNGYSRGTKHVYDKAIEAGKTAWINKVGK